MSRSDLPPGCSLGDIDRAANGSCPECGAILDDGKCEKCGWPENNDSEVECSVCREVVVREDTRICEHCCRPVCDGCEKEGELRMEKGIPTCPRCSAR